MQLWSSRLSSILLLVSVSYHSAATANLGLNQCFVSLQSRARTTSSFWKKSSGDEPHKTNHTQTPHHHNHNIHPALHQVKHRAQEKATIGIAQHVTENLVTQTTTKSPQLWWRRGTEQIMALFRKGTAEKGAERILKKGMETSAERGTERMIERGVERVAERGAERVAERGAERIAERGAERVLEGNVERIAERGIERVLEGNAERLTERGIERVLEGNAERGANRFFVQRGVRQLTTKNAERIAESGTKRFVERNGERLAEHVVERSGERGLLKWEGGLAERFLPKLGRSLSLALPALGALFGWYLLQQDLKRMKQEQKKRTKALFGVAALADCMDILLHVWIVYALWAHLSHSSMMVAEQMSLACAIGSTVSAVLGEIICSLPQNHTAENDDSSRSAIV